MVGQSVMIWEFETKTGVNDLDTLTLRNMQKAELEIMRVIDQFCREYGISYSLYAGTAIGAVRHHGFIPWDDDIDICMTRAELNRFKKCWEQDPVEGYYFENCLDDRYCGIAHTKVRKEDSLFLSEGEDESKGHHGIWVDIFPLDKIQPGWDTRKCYFHALILNMLTRANVSMRNDSGSKRMVSKMLQLLPYPLRKVWIRHEWQWFTKHNEKVKGHYDWADLSAVYMFKVRMPEKMMDEFISMNFEEISFSIFRLYDEMLRACYGDYMKLPPVEERVCGHKPAKVIF